MYSIRFDEGPRRGFRTAACAALALVMAAAPSARAQSGVNTGESITSAKPLTVNVVDPKAPTIFEDVTAKTPMAAFRNKSGTSAKDYILDAGSAGVALLDYDGDGLLDVYFVNGSTAPATGGLERAPRAALYRNRGNWQFEDVTDKAGVANERWGFGVAVGDYDNDGRPDMYVGNWGASRLYHNNGDGTFADVAEKLGVARKGWSTGASFGDYDGDGRLDLFVPGYLDFDLKRLPPRPGDATKAGGAGQAYCQFRGLNVMCGPKGLKGERDTLYHQKADGTFEDVTDKAGGIDTPKFYGWSSAFVHADDDKLLDLVVVNDSTAKQLYINKGDGTFEEVGMLSGLALNENGREQAGMGLAVGDYDNDGRLDVHVTNFSDDSNTLYHNEGDGNFTDVTFQAGLGEPTIPFVGWGTSFLDFDNDGWRDLVVTNGHVYPQVDGKPWGTSYAEQTLLFRSLAGKRFERVPAAPGSALADAHVGRGLAVGDLDGDGRLDVVVNNLDSGPSVLRNVTPNAGHWLELALVGDPARRSPRDAVGAIAYVTAGGVRQRLDVVSGASFGSQSDLRLHVGLGAATKVDTVEVQWPDGSSETVSVTAIDRVVTVVEGKGIRAN